MRFNSPIEDIVRLLGFLTYRYFLTDFIPGMTTLVVLAFYGAKQDELRQFASDYSFIKDAAGGSLLVGLIVVSALGIGVLINVASDMVLGRLIASERLSRTVINLDRTGAYEEMEGLAMAITSLGRRHPHVRMFDPDTLASGGTMEAVRARVILWLRQASPADFQRIDRYSGIGIMLRSVGLITGLVGGIELVRHLDSAPESLGYLAPILAGMLFIAGSSLVFVYRNLLTLQTGHQRQYELLVAAEERETGSGLLGFVLRVFRARTSR